MVGGKAISVMSSGAGEPALNMVAAAFEKATGRRVEVTYDGKAVRERGEARSFDVLVSSRDVLERDFRSGEIEAGTVSIGRVGIGVAIAPGRDMPDISSVERFRNAVLGANALLVTLHGTGLHVEAVFRTIGVLAQIEARLERFPDGPMLMDRLLAGRGAELGLLSINQIGRYRDKGLVLLGPLPEELQVYVEFVAVPMSAGVDKEAAWEFVRFCSGPGKPLLAAHGFG